MYTAGNKDIQNGVLTLANTEYEITLPSPYKRILIQARQYATLKVSFVPGESGTKYITIHPGTAYWEDNIRTVGSVYVQSPTAGTVVEVLTWYGGDLDG